MHASQTLGDSNVVDQLSRKKQLLARPVDARAFQTYEDLLHKKQNKKKQPEHACQTFGASNKNTGPLFPNPDMASGDVA